MSNLSVFQFESKDVRTLTDERDGSIWFVLKDVLAAWVLNPSQTQS